MLCGTGVSTLDRVIEMRVVKTEFKFLTNSNKTTGRVSLARGGALEGWNGCGLGPFGFKTALGRRLY